MPTRRHQLSLSLQLAAVMVLTLTGLVGARYITPSKFYDDMPDFDKTDTSIIQNVLQLIHSQSVVLLPSTTGSCFRDHKQKLVSDIPWFNQQLHSRSIGNPDPVQKFLDILRTPLKERPLPPETPSIYDFLEMPSMEGANAQRIAFSSTKPDYTPTIEIPPSARDKRALPYPFYKKSGQSDMSGEETLRACPAHNQWKQIERATTLENEDVIIGTEQWFWQTTCINEGASCFGFQNTQHMTSSCRPVFSWMVAWARPLDVIHFSWRFIAVETCCSCAVTVSSSPR